MRLRFSVTGEPHKGETKNAAATLERGGEAKALDSGTSEAASATNDETKIEAATGN
jgi:two-component system nitrogen regulation sensor histidine kinase NtrY